MPCIFLSDSLCSKDVILSRAMNPQWTPSLAVCGIDATVATRSVYSSAALKPANSAVTVVNDQLRYGDCEGSVYVIPHHAATSTFVRHHHTDMTRMPYWFRCLTPALSHGILYMSVFKSGTDLISLLICFLLLFFLWGRTLQKSLKLRRFKLDGDGIWQDCSSSKYASID